MKLSQLFLIHIVIVCVLPNSCKTASMIYIKSFQLLPVLSEVKNLMPGMVSFSPEDVIFLLNKWDTISHEDADEVEKYFEKTKAHLRKVWDKVDESYIFKISAKKVSLYYIKILKRDT